MGKSEKNVVKNAQAKNVYDLAIERIGFIFNEFDNICISFSGGKDSGMLMELFIDYMKSHNIIDRKISVFHMDYEAQYSATTEYVDRMLAREPNLLDVYRICVPFKAGTCTSMFDQYWRPWEDEKKDLWVRELPEKCYTKKDFPFFEYWMWDYDFQEEFAYWLHERKKANKTCCVIGIRAQESLNRWRSIYASKKKDLYKDLPWTTFMKESVYNAYPIFDWKTSDIWVANYKFGYDYNKLYDLLYQAGVPIEKQRVASPFVSEAKGGLALYKAIDPYMWGRMLGRVNGVNCAGIYGRTFALGWKDIKKPAHFTWKEYMYFLLSTLPKSARENYEKKLNTSITFWKEKGGCLSEDVIQKLRDRNIPIEVLKETNYRTKKKPVKMDYLDDIDIAEFKEIPTYKRMCVCIMKNDHLCKYMGFSRTKEEEELKKKALEKYRL